MRAGGVTPADLGYANLPAEEIVAVSYADAFLAVMEALTGPELVLAPAVRRLGAAIERPTDYDPRPPPNKDNPVP